MKRMLKRLWPYGGNIFGLLACIVAFVTVASGQGLSNDLQLVWIGVVAVWIGNHALVQHSYRSQADTSERWRKLYEQANQRRRSIWS